MTIHFGGSRRGACEDGKDANSRSLALAVAAEVAEYFASFHVEADPSQGLDASTIRLGQIRRLYRRGRGSLPMRGHFRCHTVDLRFGQ